MLTLCPWSPEPLDPPTCTVGTNVPTTVRTSQSFHHLPSSLLSVNPSCLSRILNSLLFLLNRSLLELVFSRSNFRFNVRIHPSTTFRFDLHMLDIVLSARIFPHLSLSHRILSLKCLSLEFSWIGCRRPHLHLPLMQALKMPRRICSFLSYSYGALVTMQARLGVGKYVFAYLDDIHTVTRPARVDVAHVVVEEELWSHARVHLHHGKTQVWNRGGIEPSGVEALTRATQAVKPDAMVWRGNPMLPATQQGVKVLGIPIGTKRSFSASWKTSPLNTTCFSTGSHG